MGSVNTSEVVVELWVAPLKVTDQEVPNASPASVNVTVYFVTGDRVNAMDTDWAAPATVTVPLAGVAV